MLAAIWTFITSSWSNIWKFLEYNQITNIIYILVVIVALCGPFLFQDCRDRKRKRLISFVLFSHLCQLRELLKRICNKRNAPESTGITFNETSFSEIKSEFYLYQDVFLKNLESFDGLEKYMNVMNFFRNYNCNLETLTERRSRGNPSLRRDTLDNLLEWLQKAIDEVRLKDRHFSDAEKDIVELIANMKTVPGTRGTRR